METADYSETPWLDPDAQPIVQIRGLSKRYGKTAAVDAIDLDVEQQEPRELELFCRRVGDVRRLLTVAQRRIHDRDVAIFMARRGCHRFLGAVARFAHRRRPRERVPGTASAAGTQMPRPGLLGLRGLRRAGAGPRTRNPDREELSHGPEGTAAASGLSNRGWPLGGAAPGREATRLAA